MKFGMVNRRLYSHKQLEAKSPTETTLFDEVFISNEPKDREGKM